jgi:hypothetical protein
MTRGVISNPTDSIYKNIYLVVRPSDIMKKIDANYSCTEDPKREAVKKILKESSENIMNKTNLSEKDATTINNFEKILKSVKFN